MRKVTFILHATLTYSAQRTLEIEVSEDANLQLFDPSMLNELADFDQRPWTFDECGYLAPTDYSVHGVIEGSQNLDEPAIAESQG